MRLSKLKYNYKGERIRAFNNRRIFPEEILVVCLLIFVSIICLSLPGEPQEIIPEPEIPAPPAIEDTTLQVPEVEMPDFIELEEPCIIYDIPLHTDLQSYITELSESECIDPCIIYGIIWKESNYIPDIVGDNGRSIGLMQIQRRWHEERMKKLGVYDLTDPYQNVAVGIDYLSDLIQMYTGSVEMALIAYNAGPSGAKDNYFSQGIYSNSYSQDVLSQAYSIRNTSN